ncbi:MAG: aquaporin [Phycisphaerae bacterium]|nr:MAG: aquaporin [Planctomycetota bacterium]MBE7457654.1 aquaporin [Planctomycetia bacterium]MCK6463829.1 aquaporin [Phycisphaerae bacterium]MCL4717456.1 aquaporin [Phycisphaerae bacterium]MCQ3920292.1 aquaporin [Planctomycetota bacterium]
MNDKLRNLTCEAVGTFLLTFIGAGAILTTTWTKGDPGLVGIAFAHGIALAIAVSAAMNLSGGHINPAVTVSMLATGRIKAGDAVAYIIAQCGGATIAGVLLNVIFKGVGASGAGVLGADAITACQLGTPNFGAAVPTGIAVLLEILMTFVLVYTVFGTAVDGRSPRIAGFGIGLSVAICILLGGPITGGAMNPARTIGTLIGGGSATSHLWSQHWVYWVGPIAGGLLAAFLYDGLVRPKANKG